MIEAPLAIDLCAGAGGLSLGLQAAGFRTLGVELDADAVETHRANVGPCEAIDVRAFDGKAHSAVLVAGGVPCQPFSISGAREGTAREDGRLWLELLRVADESGARAILLENVHGFTTWREDGSLFLTIVLLVLERNGWHVTHQVLDAADYGVPQNRNRVFIAGFRSVAARAAFRWPSPTHAPPGDMFLPPYRTVRDALGLGDGSFATGRRAGAKGWMGERMLDVDAPAPAVVTTTAELLGAADRPAPTITTGYDGLSKEYLERLRAEEILSRPAPTVKANSHREGHDDRRPSRRAWGRLQSALDHPASTVTAGGTGSGGGPEPFRDPEYRERLSVELADAGLLDRSATTVAADPRLPRAGHHDRQQNGAVRLRPQDLAALQDFPPDFIFTGKLGSQHRQIGNAVPRAVGEALGRSIRAALAADEYEAPARAGGAET